MRYVNLLATILALGLWGLPQPAVGQEAESIPNLVPNPGFESYAIPPIGWFYRGVYFSKVMKFWTSPTAASPDAYGPRTRVPAHWSVQGFGEAEPHGGTSMVGLTLFGCRGGKPHCREYLQTLLNEPLVPGQPYELAFWVRSLPRSQRIDRIGAAFSPREQQHLFDTLLALPTTLYADTVVGTGEGWQFLRWTFIPEQAADYLLIGNFFPDDSTRTLEPAHDPLPFAYYYIDDISLVKVPPFVEAPQPPALPAEEGLAVGSVHTLHNIFFDFDRDELLPRSYIELEALFRLLQAKPGMRVRINGHTDNVGDDSYNQDLSERRARAVVDYLTQRGIDPDRLGSRGYGEARPVAANATDEGRQANRRVEFEVLSL